MLRKGGFRIMAALALAALLAGPPVSVEAAGWGTPGAGSGAAWQGWEDLWHWLQKVVAFATADKGISVDPDGAAANSDAGHLVDPNGATADSDKGPLVDPDGATADSDKGSSIDPNG